MGYLPHFKRPAPRVKKVHPAAFVRRVCPSAVGGTIHEAQHRDKIPQPRVSTQLERELVAKGCLLVFQKQALIQQNRELMQRLSMFQQLFADKRRLERVFKRFLENKDIFSPNETQKTTVTHTH